MCLVEESVEALERLINVIRKILNEFEGDNGLIEEMKSYELKKNIAKTTGTVIGIAGVCLSPFTLGWSLAVSATAAGVHLITEFVDSNESREFRERIEEHLDAYQEHCEALKKLIKTLESEIQSSAQNSVQTALLYCALSVETNEFDKTIKKLNICKVTTITGVAGVAGFAHVQQTGKSVLKATVNAAGKVLILKQTGKSALMATVKAAGKVTVIFGSIVTAYEVVTLFMDWKGTHPTIAGAKKVVEELKKVRSSLNERMANIKKGVTIMCNKQGNGDKDESARRKNESAGRRDEKVPWMYHWLNETSTSTNKHAPSTGGGGGGGDKRPPKPTKDEKDEKVRNETKVVVESDTILPNGQRILKVSAIVRPENLGQGTDTNNSVARNWRRRLNLPGDYHAGHIIASMLGGSGSDVNNLVLMHRNFNNGDFKNFEFHVRSLLAPWKIFYFRHAVEARINVTISFAPGGMVPCHIRYEVCLFVNGVEQNDQTTRFSIDCCLNGPHDGPYIKRSF